MLSLRCLIPKLGACFKTSIQTKKVDVKQHQQNQMYRKSSWFYMETQQMMEHQRNETKNGRERQKLKKGIQKINFQQRTIVKYEGYNTKIMQ